METQTSLQCLHTKCTKVSQTSDTNNNHVTSATGLACIFWPENDILVLIACMQTPQIKVHTGMIRVAIGLYFDLRLNLHSYCVYVSNKRLI